MGKTFREYKGEAVPDKSKKKVVWGKFFGYSSDAWARGMGKGGRKRSYGHFSGLAPGYPKGLYNEKKQEYLD